MNQTLRYKSFIHSFRYSKRGCLFFIILIDSLPCITYQATIFCCMCNSVWHSRIFPSLHLCKCPMYHVGTWISRLVTNLSRHFIHIILNLTSSAPGNTPLYLTTITFKWLNNFQKFSHDDMWHFEAKTWSWLTILWHSREMHDQILVTLKYQIVFHTTLFSSLPISVYIHVQSISLKTYTYKYFR